MLRRGFIRRLPNRADRRSHRLALTRSGIRIYREIVPLALEHETQLLQGFGAQDRQRLDRLLRRLESSAQRALNSFNISHTEG